MQTDFESILLSFELRGTSANLEMLFQDKYFLSFFR